MTSPLSIVCYKDGGSSENLRGRVVIWWVSSAPLVDIGLINLPKYVGRGGVCPPWPPVPSSLQCCNSAVHSVAYTYMLARAFASHSLMFSERRRLKQYAAWKKMNYKTRNPTLLTDQMQTSLQLRRGTTYVIPTSYMHMRGVKIWPWFLIATACIIYYRIVPSLHIKKENTLPLKE